MDRMRAVNEGVSSPIPPHTPERIEYALQLLDARAEPFLDLVSDLPSQEAYAVVLGVFAHLTCGDYTGITNGVPLPGSEAMRRIESRTHDWLRESYDRAATASQCQSNVSDATPLERLPEILKSLRNEARLTVEKVAEAIGVKPRSVSRHESGETKVRGSNLKSYEEFYSKTLKRDIRLPGK